MDRYDVIRKLMDTARSLEVDNPEASQSYTDKAVALATKFGIEDALTQVKTDPGKTVLRSIKLDNPYAKHRATLLHIIATNLNCVVIKTGSNVADLFGNSHDVESVEFIYGLVLNHMLSGVTNTWPVTSTYHYRFKTGMTPAEVKSHRVSWLLGYITGINTRMAAAYRTSVAEAKAAGNTGAEIVLADRKAVAKQFSEQYYPNTRKAAASKVRDNHAYFSGKASSAHANLGQTGVGGRRTAIQG